MGQTWRLIPLRVTSGTEQMAIDRFWLEQLSQDPNQPPILRFYTWQPAALSLGLHQSVAPPWADLIERYQLELVRRPSGGRAVLHQGDLCYAIISPILFPERSQNYAYLCQFLLEGLNSLCTSLSQHSNLAPASFSFGSKGREYVQQPNCFATATAADLVLNLPGKAPIKLVGSAQTYTRTALLQHGSILIQPHPQLWQDFWGDSPLGLHHLFPQLSIAELTEILIKYLCDAAVATWKITLMEQDLSPAESSLIGIET
ncbi:MAG: lipoate--protein ligase family protein [Pseudanabaenaceae cyanobacterium bins.68]|nr:lipoate--protein ligase family protein [Pseudanabaenaceae cyanobacterium bins.68]